MDNLMSGLGVYGKGLVDSGRYQEALDLTLDLALYSQNLGRGWATLHRGSGAAGQWLGYAFPNLARLLDEDLLTALQLQQLIREADVLLGSEPRPITMVVADQFDLMMKVVLPSFFGPTWVPPRPLPAKTEKFLAYQPRMDHPMPPPGIFQAPSDVMFLYLWTRLRSIALLEECAGLSTDLGCILAVGRRYEEEALVANEANRLKAFLVALNLFGPAEGTVLFLATRANPPRGPMFVRAMYRYLARPTMLAFLRVHAALLLQLKQTGALPTAEDLGGPQWARLLQDRTFGGRFLLKLDGNRLQLSVDALPQEVPLEQRRDFTYTAVLPTAGAVQ
jgi:hypothetical protein